MPRNASGVYTLPGGNPVTPGDVIEAEWANTTLEDVANELTNSLSRTGAGGMLAPFRIADGTITAPGMSFLNETNTGLYRSGAGSAWMAVLGVNVAQFSTVGLTIASAKSLTALGNASVGGTFAVGGATTLASTLAVTGALTATGGVLGNITAGSGTSTFNNVVINGDLDMSAGSSGTITNLPNPTNPGDAANKAYVDSQDALRLALTGGTMTGVIAMSNNKVTGLATPTADQDAANKAYVDSVAQGIDAKASCRAATTANITLSGTQTIDGVAVIAGDRVLVKNQSSAADNGIYVAAVSTWSRSADANTWDELVAAFTFVENGTENGNNGYICTIAPGGTLGVTAVTWAQFSGAGQIIAGQGLSKTGNTIQVNTASSARIVIGADEIDLATTGVVANTYKSVTVDQWGRVTGGTNPTTLAGFGIGDAYTQAQTDSLLAAKLSLAGGTMAGAIAMGGSKITGMADPTLAQDAATKNYIDTIFGSTASAAASASAAATSASNAASSASSASTSASNASSSATSAAASATSAAASFDSFDDRYLGAKASDPTVDNDGNPLLTGALYWNTTVSQMRVYDGSAWVAAYLPVGAYMDLTTNQTAAGVKTFSSNPILSAGTANGLVYLNGSKALTSGSTITFDGTNIKVATSGITANAYLAGFSLTFDRNADNYIYAGGGASSSLNLNADNSLKFNVGSGFPSTPEIMRVTSTGLGIGTSSPVAKLHVKGATNGNLLVRGGASAVSSLTGTALSSINDAASATVSLTFEGSDFNFVQSNAVTAKLDSSGNLGLGVTPSAWNSNYKGFQMNGGALQAYTSGDRFAVNQNAFVNSGGVSAYVNNGYASQYLQLNSEHRFYTAPSGTAGNAITFTQAMTLDASGNLGVGTSSPASKLDVNSTASRVLDITSSNASGCFLRLVNSSTALGYLGSAKAIFGNNLADLALDVSGANNLIFGTNDTERARIDSSGNLGIGQTSPAYSLDIGTAAANIRIAPSTTTNNALTRFVNGGGTGYVGLDSNSGGLGGQYSLNIWHSGAYPIVFGTSDTARARIDASGNLLVNTTASEGNAKIVTVSPTNGISIRTTAAANSYEAIVASRTSTVGKAITLWYDLNTGQQAGFINIDSTSTVSLNNTSDYRVKEDIQPLTNSIARIQNLKPVSFKFKADGYFAEGFIAHEFAEVIPQAVHGEKDAVDEDGKPVYQAIDQSKIIPLLTAAIQEQQAIIESLKARLDAANI